MAKDKILTFAIITIMAIAALTVFIPQAAAPVEVRNNPSSTSGGWSNPTNAYTDSSTILDGSTSAFTWGPVGTQQTYSGYGFNVNVPNDKAITSVIVLLDIGSLTGVPASRCEIKFEISPDGIDFYTLPAGSTFPSYVTPGVTAGTFLAPVSSGGRILIDVSSWVNEVGGWTTSNIDNIAVRITKNNVLSAPYLDWIPVLVTYDSTSVVPEYALGGLSALAISFVALVVFMKRSSIPSFKHQ